MVIRNVSHCFSFGLCLWIFALAASVSSAQEADIRRTGTTGAKSTRDALQTAREKLVKGDLATAQKSYAAIPFGEPLWIEKVEDLVRYHLLKGTPLEAWRLVQILKRVRLSPNAISEYEKLTVFKSQGCPLALRAVDARRDALLDAASYRYQSIVKSSANSVRAVEGASVGPGIVPFLADIPRTRIIRGRGCRLAKFAGGETSRAKLELKFLLSALQTFGPVDATVDQLPRLMIAARALQLLTELPIELRDKRLSIELGKFLPKESEINWSEVPDEERRRLFSRYFPTEKKDELEASLRNRAHEIAMQVLRNPTDPKDADWLAMVDLSKLAVEEKISLFSALEKTGSFEGRVWILFSLADAHYEAGHATEALSVLRRLLREGEEKTDAAFDEATVDLAARIFSEHRFEERLVGAMQAAIPSRLWWQMVDGAAVRAAIRGQAADFAKIQSLMIKKSALGSMMKAQVSLWAALASRDFKSFSKRLRSLDRGNATDRLLISLGGILASEMVSSIGAADAAPADALSGDAVWKKTAPYARELAAEIRSRIRPGDARANELGDLAQILESESAWSDGGRSVKKGAVVLGVAKFKRRVPQRSEFRLKPPVAIPLRELIYLPDNATARGWVLSTTIR